jgi:hypothetical protein
MNMTDVVFFGAIPLILAAKYLYNQFIQLSLPCDEPEVRTGKSTGQGRVF